MHRHSSRRVPSLGKSFLAERLRGARSYDRIAGYFSSSILEVAGEELESMTGKVRIICNSELDPDDVKSARAAAMAMRREWCRHDQERLAEKGADRFARLYRFLASGKLEVNVLPDSAFGLIHGKAGVIEMAGGRVTSFLGSANESRTARHRNIELVWEDEHPESIQWVRVDFDAPWGHPHRLAAQGGIKVLLDRREERVAIDEQGCQRTVHGWRARSGVCPHPPGTLPGPGCVCKRHQMNADRWVSGTDC